MNDDGEEDHQKNVWISLKMLVREFIDIISFDKFNSFSVSLFHHFTK